MNLHPLIARFESVAESPGNIQRLRKLVINLAIGGTLIADDNGTPPVREILSRIGKDKARRSKFEKNGRQTVLVPVVEDDLPIGCADPARFVRLEDIASMEKGLTSIQSALPGEFPLVTTAERKSHCDHFDFDGRAAIVPLVSSTGHGSATLNRLHYHEGKFALGTILCAIFPYSEEIVSARFIFEYLSAFKEELLVSRMTGTANVTLTLGRIGAVPIPVVAPNVQRRSEQLMTLCDELEAAQLERESRRDRLTAATYHHLNNGTDSKPLRKHVQFFIGHLPRLTARPEQIKQLRQTILNLAVRGQLGTQHSDDESATKLLSRKAILPDGYRRRRKVLKEQSLAPTGDIFPPIPPSWECRDIQSLYEMNVIIDYADGNHGALYPRASEFGDSGVLFVTAKDLIRGKVGWSSCAKLNEHRAQELTKGWAQGGDVLLTHNATVGRVARVEPEAGRFLLGTSVTFYRLNSNVVDPNYFFHFLQSRIWQGQLEAIMQQTTRNQVSIQKQAFFQVTIPPLAEQHRIVATVDKLMPLCDQLEAQLTSAQTDTSRLLEAVLYNSLNAGNSTVGYAERLLQACDTL
jgi:type I restriction enzyme, S subunit